MQTLHHLRNEPGGARTEGILRRMHNQKFVGTVCMMTKILSILDEISRVFQRNSVDFNFVHPSPQRTKDKLRSIPLHSVHRTDRYNYWPG